MIFANEYYCAQAYLYTCTSSVAGDTHSLCTPNNQNTTHTTHTRARARQRYTASRRNAHATPVCTGCPATRQEQAGEDNTDGHERLEDRALSTASDI